MFRSERHMMEECGLDSLKDMGKRWAVVKTVVTHSVA